ncbi:cytochrome P450 [Westerdykella ornata]|uniref:Cytochrome P450 n=1 Tax=Westerdykella ornata TaxID=318751 RepID=A0A6A6JK85_WESOR|nr:cytochrome P450 [Westerdykella ornata]KAF2276917.1 cytochrome P450 [Westerdykella ornata]
MLAQNNHTSVLLSALRANVYFQVFLGCSFAWLLWRLWRFTIHPRLYPDEPKTYPYWIPFIGHSITFFRDAEETMQRARLYFNNTRDPFKLIIMGEIVYVITSAQDTVSVYKNDAFSLNPWLMDLMRQFGASDSSIRAMWSCVPDKPVKEICVMLFRTLLNPGNYSEAMLDVLLSTVHTRMTWDQVPEWMVLSRPSAEGADVSLLKWSQHVLLEGATRSFFGDALLEVEPNLFESFYEFDDSSWKLPYNIPDLFAQDVKRSKKTAEAALARYFALPRSRRSDASKLVFEIESVLRSGGIGNEDMGVLVLMFYWVINANAWKASFWMLTHILTNPSLHSAILSELSPFITPTSPCTLSGPALATALQSHCPTLLAVYHEALRISASSTSVRIVMSDTYIRNFKLLKGARMVIPYRQMMLDEGTYGADPASFQHERFLQNPGLVKHPNYRPFGGGSSLCPGRAFAMKEILTFVGLAVGKFGVRLSEEAVRAGKEGRGVVPEMNTKTPCIGIMAPTGEGDVRVRIERPSW